MIQNLDVFLWNRKVGTLVAYKEKYKEKVCFYFDSNFVKGGYDIAPLQAPINGVTAQRGLPVYAEDDKIFGGLPSFIADSLPDHWGNRVFNEWAKVHHIKSRDLSSLDRLAYIGRRGMGALEFIPPAAEEMEKPFKVEIEDLYRLARTAFNEAKDFKTEMQPDLMIESLFKVGTSAGGRRAKAIIHVNRDTNECYSGQVNAPAPGFTPMIIKFDEHLDLPTTRIEYSYYLMARNAGMEMMPSMLIEGEKEVHFLTERFDRKGNEKNHIQTLAAMNPAADSYESLFDTACRIGIIPAEMHRLFLSMTMNVLGGNVDDHNKNFSFMMGQDGVWHITPTYDFTFSVDPSAPGYVNRHCMTINNKNSAFERGDLLEVAKKYNIKGADSLIEKAIGVVSDYQRYAHMAGVDGYWSHQIKEEINDRIEMLSEMSRQNGFHR